MPCMIHEWLHAQTWWVICVASIIKDVAMPENSYSLGKLQYNY